MDIRAQPDVVRQIPAVMIGVFVNHNVIAVPEPIVAYIKLKRRHAKVVSGEPEPRWTAALQTEDEAGANAAWKVSVLPWMIQMKTRIIPSEVVANPPSIPVHMRRIRMPGLIRMIRRVPL